jgi:hypothetical protein
MNFRFLYNPLRQYTFLATIGLNHHKKINNVYVDLYLLCSSLDPVLRKLNSLHTVLL